MEEDNKESAKSESLISRDDVEIEVAVSSDEPVVYVKFSNFQDYEDAEEYAEFLADTLPLLLFETTRVH
jgi:SepF-like predicted cell division protein (DUF552 family)